MAKNKVQLTKKFIESIKPSPHGERLNYYDDKVAGLQLCVFPTGVRSFSVLKWVNGKTRRVVLGRYDGMAMQSPEFDKDPLCVLGNNPVLTVEQARQLAIAVITELSAGHTSKRELRRHSADTITLGELFIEYLDKYAIEHTKTWKVMEECFYRYLDCWKNRPIGEIKRSEVQQFINKLGKENGKTTANRTLELLRAVINKGKQWELVTGENPASGVTKFKLKSRDRFLHEDEIKRLLASIEEEGQNDITDFILISLYTGARKNNVLSMRWPDIDLNNASWTIPDTKNDTSQTILLTEPELQILRRRLMEQKRESETGEPGTFVFPGPGVAGHRTDPKKGWNRILKRAELENVHLHDLRRTLGSYMAMTGASLSVIGNALNHKDVSTTRKVYAHSAREAERIARERAHKRMFASDEPKSEGNVISLDVKRDKSVEF